MNVPRPEDIALRRGAVSVQTVREYGQLQRHENETEHLVKYQSKSEAPVRRGAISVQDKSEYEKLRRYENKAEHLVTYRQESPKK